MVQGCWSDKEKKQKKKKEKDSTQQNDLAEVLKISGKKRQQFSQKK